MVLRYGSEKCDGCGDNCKKRTTVNIIVSGKRFLRAEASALGDCCLYTEFIYLDSDGLLRKNNVTRTSPTCDAE